MRVIPLKAGPTLFVLESLEGPVDQTTLHICKSSHGGIVLYAEDLHPERSHYRMRLYTLEELDSFLDQPDLPSWYIDTYNSMAKARPTLARHIRDQRIEDLLSGDEEPQMWA
jgi:hypothetical protein